MRGVCQVVFVAAAIVVAGLSGCRYRPPLDAALEPISLAIEAEVTDVFAFSGPVPAGVAKGQHITLTLTFLSAYAHSIDRDSTHAAYNLDRRDRNAIKATLGTLNWKSPLSQVLIYDDVPGLGDRLAVNGWSYTSFPRALVPAAPSAVMRGCAGV